MKKNRILVAAVALSLCSVSLFGCGGSSSQTDEPTDDQIKVKLESMDEDDIEDALDSLDGAEDGGEAVPAATEEETYEPSEEILNASLTSGLVQIGDDIFKEGGYYTVSSFLAEFGDKYEEDTMDAFAPLNPDGYLEAGGSGITFFKKKNSKVYIWIMYGNFIDDKKSDEPEKELPNDGRIKVGDAIVYYIGVPDDGLYSEQSKTEWAQPYQWYGGQKKLDEYKTLTYDDAKPFLESLGWKEADPNELTVNTFGDSENEKKYAAPLKLDEKNLLGVYPVVYVDWYYDLSQNAAGDVYFNYYNNSSNQQWFWYTAAELTQEGNTWKDENGTPVVDLP